MKNIIKSLTITVCCATTAVVSMAADIVKVDPMELSNMTASPASSKTLKIKGDAQRYDSLLSIWYKNNIIDLMDGDVSGFIDINMDERYDAKQTLPDSVYKQRLDMLATAIQLPYNPIVKQYILNNTIKYRSMLSRVLGLSQYYMPIFEQQLDLNGLPEELKIMPVIESLLNPKAMSRAGAAGLWQFMLPVGKSYGLEINSFVDERMDPIRSTKAACKLLKDYYRLYGDWTLVIAAYNCGPGNVNKAIKRVPGNGAKTYWDIYEYLPRETRGHIPAFIAMTYAYTFHKAHNIEPASPPHPIVTDTITVNKMMHFNQISSSIGIPIDMLRNLNPQYKLDIIPAKSKKYSLVLPVSDVSNFIEHEKEIYAKDTLYLAKYIGSGTSAGEDFTSEKGTPVVGSTKSSSGSSSSSTAKKATTTSYKVRRGDNLSSIAAKYKVTVKQLMQWNGLSDPRKLREGMTLKIKR